jgi:hypothetical protein
VTLGVVSVTEPSRGETSGFATPASPRVAFVGEPSPGLPVHPRYRRATTYLESGRARCTKVQIAAGYLSPQRAEPEGHYRCAIGGKLEQATDHTRLPPATPARSARHSVSAVATSLILPPASIRVRPRPRPGGILYLLLGAVSGRCVSPYWRGSKRTTPKRRTPWKLGSNVACDPEGMCADGLAQPRRRRANRSLVSPTGFPKRDTAGTVVAHPTRRGSSEARLRYWRRKAALVIPRGALLTVRPQMAIPTPPDDTDGEGIAASRYRCGRRS